MSMSNNIPISPFTENNLSIIKDLPIIQNILMTENNPMVENVPIIDDVPTVKGMPIVGNVPIVEKTPIIKDVQITKELSYCKLQKISHKRKRFIFYWTPYDETISKITKFHYDITFSTKAMILLNKFPHIKRTKSQIISHAKYTNNKISKVCNNLHVKITSSTQNGIGNFKISNKCMILKIVSIEKKTRMNQNMLIHIGKNSRCSNNIMFLL
jgi:hypothetical protein